MSEAPRAKRGDWKTLPFPEPRVLLPLQRTFVAPQVARIERGIVPRGMEERWFVFTEEHRVHFFRSWTGSAVYEVELEPTEKGGMRISAAWMALQNGLQVDVHDEARRLSNLFDVLFFGRS